MIYLISRVFLGWTFLNFLARRAVKAAMIFFRESTQHTDKASIWIKQTVMKDIHMKFVLWWSDE